MEMRLFSTCDNVSPIHVKHNIGQPIGIVLHLEGIIEKLIDDFSKGKEINAKQAIDLRKKTKHTRKIYKYVLIVHYLAQ